MLRDRWDANDPREWLSRARSNLLRAEQQLPGVFFEDLCFDAQQAAEKAIKAVFVARREAFPYVHDLAKLLERLDQNGENVPANIRRASELSRYAVATRYLGMADPVTTDDYKDAITIAAAVLAWAEQRILQE